MWILNQPLVMALIEADKKINAIKEVRALTALDLKAAKDAVELAMTYIRDGVAKRMQVMAQQVDEAEEAEAIRSIKEALKA